jgi:hypothetical protein
MTTTSSNPLFRVLSIAAVLAALAVAGCGGGSSATSSSTPAQSSSPPASSSSTPSSSGGSSASGIPQGPNAGDADADNHGGPSDGDGNI